MRRPGSEGERRAQLRRVYAALLIFDIGAGSAILIACSQFPLFDGRTSLALSVLRLIAWFTWVHLRLAPLRAWWREQSEATLRRADATLQVFGSRAALVCGGSWVVLGLLNLGLSFARWPALVGGSEISMGVTFAIGCGLGTWSLTGPMFDSLLITPQLELSEALAAHGLNPARPEHSLTKRSLSLLVGTCVACVLGTAGMAMNWRLEGVRQAATQEAAQRAAIASSTLDDARVVHAEEPPRTLDGAQVMHADELPSALARAPVVRQGAFELRQGYDPRAQLGWGAVRRPGSQRWMVASVSADERTAELSLLLLVFSAAIVVTVSIPAYGLGRSTEAPLEQFGEAARAFAREGQLRALQRMVPLRGDSISRLATYLGEMLDNLEQLSAAAEAVANGELAVELEQPGELHDAFRGMVARLRESVGSLNETARALTEVTAEIDALTEQQQRSVEQQAQRSVQAELSLTTLTSTAQDIAETAGEVLEDAERGEQTGRTMSEQLAALDGQTTTVTELLTGIRDVADRSDLLALNGALEATRAGEVGRNFALVASEMRRLAERVADLVGEVDTQLVLMRESSARALVVAREREQLDRRTADAARAISQMTARQSGETSKISAGISEIATHSMSAAEAAVQTREAVEGMRAQTAAIEQICARFEL